LLGSGKAIRELRHQQTWGLPLTCITDNGRTWVTSSCVMGLQTSLGKCQSEPHVWQKEQACCTEHQGSVVQDRQRSACPWSRLSLWLAVGGIFLCNCKYSALFCLSHLWQMYFPSKCIFPSPLHCAVQQVGASCAELAAPRVGRMQKHCEHRQLLSPVMLGQKSQMVSGAGCDGVQNTGIQDRSKNVAAEDSFK